MEEEDTKQCPNCKREIPAINFTTHSVHCARNLRTCPVCKEPVPVAQLQEHHDALHKEVPCKKCGESVCGTDLEDHIRDSCAQTIKPCRYCELELPRHALPAHEAYCGARSEQCPECREYVMLKYRQLHMDSNHGFIRLDDDPAPKEVKPKPKLTNPISNGVAVPSNSRQDPPRASGTKPATRLDPPQPSQRPKTEIRYYEPSSSTDRQNMPSSSNLDRMDNRVANSVDSRASERNGRLAKWANDRPQINTNVEPRDKVNKELPSRGAVKKRPAPPPPQPPQPDPRRDLPYWSARKRAQDEESRRQEQTAYNLSVGLPPVLSAAAKLDKLRKMDALHNREVEEDYSHKLQGRVWRPVEPDGHTLGGDLSHLQPMTAQQFMDRFQELQLGADRGAPAPAPRGDRLGHIKAELRDLRRELGEVTAPYNSASNPTNNTQIIDSNRLRAPSPAPEPADGALRLPCEFCGVPTLAEDLVLHQTGCRPDLARYKPRKASRSRSPRAPRPRTVSEMDEPVIPCEFCTESLPVYLISEHQERCRRESNFLYPD